MMQAVHVNHYQRGPEVRTCGSPHQNAMSNMVSLHHTGRTGPLLLEPPVTHLMVICGDAELRFISEDETTPLINPCPLVLVPLHTPLSLL